MHSREAVQAMGAQVQQALATLSACPHDGPGQVCAACAARARGILKRAQETAERAGWRGPDVF